MNSASSSNVRCRTLRLRENLVSRSGQSSGNPDRLDQEDATNSLSEEQEPLPVVRRVLLRKMKMSGEDIAHVTGGEAGVRENRNRMNAGGTARANLDVSVIELDQEDHEIDSSRQDSNPNDLSSIDPLPGEVTNESRAGPSSVTVSGSFNQFMDRIRMITDELTNASDGVDNRSLGPLPLPGHSQLLTEMMEDVITIDDEEDPGVSSDEDIMIFSPSPQAAAQDTNTPDSLNDASDNPRHMPSENENNTTIDLTYSDSPLSNKVKAAGSSSNASSVPESSPVNPSREPLTCPICIESYVALCKGNVKIWFLECGHVCCGPCLQECLRRRQQCPVCRAGVRSGAPRQLFL